GGVLATKLLPGEQLTTNSAMSPVPVIEEISWSRNAVTHLALLEKSVPVLERSQPETAEPPAQNPAGRLEQFGGASGKTVDPAPAGGRGLPGTGVSTGPCIGSGPDIDPGRFAINSTLYYLITAAYGMGSCLATYDRLSGGPDWVKSDRWAVQAAIPDGTPG